MKTNIKIILLLLINSSITLNLSAQEEIIANYDIREKRIKIRKKGVKKSEDGFRLKVIGINSILHKVSFKFKDFELESEPPKLLNELFPQIGIETTSANIHNLLNSRLITVTENSVLILNGFNSLEKEITDFKKEIDSASVKVDEEKIRESSEKIIKKWISILESLNEVSANTANFVEITNNEITNILDQYEKLNSHYINSTNVNSNSLKLGYRLATLKRYYSAIKNSKNKILSVLSALNIAYKKKTKTSAKSRIHIPEKDFTNVEIYIIDRFNPSDTIFSKKTDLFLKKKFKIDFSTGIVANTLVQKEYFFTRTDTLKTGIGSEKSGGLDIAVGALLHLDWRLGPGFALGPTVGIAISLIDEKPRYFVGLGGSIGKYKSISVSTGINFGQVKVLSEQVSSNGKDFNKEIDLEQFESVPLASKIKSGFFFGITYNLTRTKK